MSKTSKTNERPVHQDEIAPNALSGMPILLLNIVLMLAAIAVLIQGIRVMASGGSTALGTTFIIMGSVYFLIVGPILFVGLKVLKPNEALVLTLSTR